MITRCLTRALAACALLCTAAAPLALSACGGASSTPGSNGGAGAATGGDLAILFSPMYSAFDGTHTFQIPAVVDGVKGVQWSASDPSMVDLTTNADGSVTIAVRKAGTATINARAGSLTGSSQLTITQAAESDWEAGNQRYNNGVVLGPRGPGQDAGVARQEAACSNCHGSNAGMLDVQHTPEQTGGYSDDDLVNIFTKAQKPAGGPQRIMPLEQWQKIHQWTMTADEQKGLVVYLRSLTPQSQGPVDFGGQRSGGYRHRDGGAPPDGGPPPGH
jgi:hypothetical protein